MKETGFDPYYSWLGIPRDEQPPHYYRLLGLTLYEADQTVIRNAADRQMTFIKEQALGEHSKASQQLLNELAKARKTLLNVQSKLDYDQQLVQRLSPPPPVGPPAVEPSAKGTQRPLVEAPVVNAPVVEPVRIKPQRSVDRRTSEESAKETSEFETETTLPLRLERQAKGNPEPQELRLPKAPRKRKSTRKAQETAEPEHPLSAAFDAYKSWLLLGAIGSGAVVTMVVLFWGITSLSRSFAGKTSGNKIVWVGEDPFAAGSLWTGQLKLNGSPKAEQMSLRGVVKDRTSDRFTMLIIGPSVTWSITARETDGLFQVVKAESVSNAKSGEWEEVPYDFNKVALRDGILEITLVKQTRRGDQQVSFVMNATSQ